MTGRYDHLGPAAEALSPADDPLKLEPHEIVERIKSEGFITIGRWGPPTAYSIGLDPELIILNGDPELARNMIAEIVGKEADTSHGQTTHLVSLEGIWDDNEVAFHRVDRAAATAEGRAELIDQIRKLAGLSPDYQIMQIVIKGDAGMFPTSTDNAGIHNFEHLPDG